MIKKFISVQIQINNVLDFSNFFISDQSLISKELIKAAFQTNANILKTDNSSLWRIFPTREFRSICDSQGVIENAAMKFIQQSDESMSYLKFTVILRFIL